MLTTAIFLAPAMIMLGIWMVYPAVYTIIRSFFGQTGFLGTWVGIDNYKHLFTTSTLTTAIKNNAIWVAVVPALVTASASAGASHSRPSSSCRWRYLRSRPA